MGNFNTPGEWCIAYHGVGRGRSSDEIKRIIGLIYKAWFKAGPNQAHSQCSDIYREGAKVGVGVSISWKPKIAEDYAGISEINGKKYKSVLMVRVKPYSIRNCNCFVSSDYYVVNGTNEEIRPYRILFKEC